MNRLLTLALVLMMALVSSDLPAATSEVLHSQIEASVQSFFDKLRAGDSSAIKSLYESNPWASARTNDIANLEAQIANLTQQVGAYKGNLLLHIENVADRFVYLYYMVLYERQPIRFEFEYYRPDKHWSLFSFSISTDIVSDIRQDAREHAVE